MPDLALSFVIPIFNEAQGIEQLWSGLEQAGRRACPDLVDRWEVVLVDDGSTDGSAQLLDALRDRHEAVRVVHHETNQGLGGALRTGFAEASGDIVLYTDADLPFDLALVDGLLRPIVDGEVDMVSARRVGRAREGTWRAIQSVVFNLCVRAWLRLPYRDVNFACKAARRSAVPPHLVSTSGIVDVEWLLYARAAGARIAQPRVEFLPRRWGRSTLGSLRTVPAMARDLRRVRAAAPPGAGVETGVGTTRA